MVASLAAGRWPAHVDGEWTVDLLDSLPENGLRYEIIDGTLQVSPTPVPVHQRVVLELAICLRGVCPPDSEVFVAPLDWQPDNRTSLEPDVLVVPKTAIGRMKITGTPSLVVEVASPSTARIDRVLKFSRYAEGGIGQYWIVDPTVPSVEIFNLVDGSYVLLTEGAGDQSVSVTEPLNVTVVPNQLISG